MKPGASIGERRFTDIDQRIFASLSGDFNPMHLDPVATRRMPPGAPVVHGMHALLWSLERLALRTSLARLCGIEARFDQFLYLGEAAVLRIAAASPERIRAELRVDEKRVALYDLRFGSQALPPELEFPESDAIIFPAACRQCLALERDALQGVHGAVAPFAADADAARTFPTVARDIGASRLTSMLQTTRLVGMVVPGLHSVFHSVSLKLSRGHDYSSALLFGAPTGLVRFGVMIIPVRGNGVFGAVTASRRPEPVEQSSSLALRTLMPQPLFCDHVAMVVGGSRGLGELTAKLLGLAGVHVIITYASSVLEAELVVDDIRSAGGSAEAVQYDVLAPAGPQLDEMASLPGSIYYFATPRIGQTAPGTFSRERFALFCAYYLTGFHDLCTALAARIHGPIRAFYPSSVFVTTPAPNMAEYTAAKAAGEIMADDLAKAGKSISVDIVRLPRLPTDQTSGIVDRDFAAPVDHLLPVILRNEREVEARKCAA